MKCEKVKFWEYKGLKCALRWIGSEDPEDEFFHYCGYAEVPPSLIPMIENEGIRLNIEVHGGVTFSGHFVNDPDMDKDVYWIGFDTGHFEDENFREEFGVSPLNSNWTESRATLETEHLADEILRLLPRLERRVRDLTDDKTK